MKKLKRFLQSGNLSVSRAAILVAVVVLVLTGTYTVGKTITGNATSSLPVLNPGKDYWYRPILGYSKHIKTPKPLKAIYMTDWVAGTRDWRAELIDFIDRSEINAVVINIKDETGGISFQIDHPLIKEIGSAENRIDDLPELIKELHDRNIYVIGRVAVFQDPKLVRAKPEIAVKRKSDGQIWKDRKGISWIDAGAKEAWEYVAIIGKESYKAGFDEINYDYVRFPSDGNMDDIYFPRSNGRVKHEVVGEFFAYIGGEMKKSKIPVSVDIFGMTTTNYDDLNIGQLLEDALPNFDYIAPMVYPSHYPPTFIGLANPAEHPYEVIHYTMKAAVDRAKLASTSPDKLRPWLQDFDLGADYDAAKVRAQMQATYDVGLDSWMMWDPSNRYTRGAYLRE